jgi:hypothetical protein
MNAPPPKRAAIGGERSRALGAVARLLELARQRC